MRVLSSVKPASNHQHHWPVVAGNMARRVSVTMNGNCCVVVVFFLFAFSLLQQHIWSEAIALASWQSIHQCPFWFSLHFSVVRRPQVVNTCISGFLIKKRLYQRANKRILEEFYTFPSVASERNYSYSSNIQPEPKKKKLQRQWKNTWKLTLQSEPKCEARRTSHASLPVAWQSLRAGLTLITVEYSTAASVSANWANPAGFRIIRPSAGCALSEEWGKTRGVSASQRKRNERRMQRRSSSVTLASCGAAGVTNVDRDWWLQSDTVSIFQHGGN